MKITPTVLRWLAIAWTITMLIGCLTPHNQVPDELITWNDKFLHLAIFALFAILWLLAGYPIRRVIISGLILGALIEIFQYILPINRSADWFDLVADGVGTGIGVGLTLVWYRLFPNHTF